MHSFAGTWQLLRLALRRDRLKLPVWIAAIGVLLFISVLGVVTVYKTDTERHSYAVASAVSGVTRAFNGPLAGMDKGSIAVAETFTSYVVVVCLMSSLLIVRHTRQNEEKNRTELLSAAPVGRFAQLCAALLLAIIANLLVSTVAFLAYYTSGLDWEGSLLAGVALGATGLLFAAIAAVAAQLAQTARSANGLVIMVLAASFLLRAIGDMQGNILPDGISAVSGWLTWLSPLGWGRLTNPYTHNDWAMIGIIAVATSLCAITALMLLRRRDVGGGFLAPRAGRTQAGRSLRGSIGIAWRLQRSLWAGWAGGLTIMAATLGAVAKEVTVMAEGNEDFSAIIASIGGSGNLIEAYIRFSMSLLGVAVAAYSIQACLRLRSEESEGAAENILALPMERVRWVWGHLVVVLGMAAALLLLIGLSAGISHGLATGEVFKQVGDLLELSLLQLPAVMVFVAISLFAWSFVPVWSVGIVWSIFLASFVVNQLGELLKLPEWLRDASPFSQVAGLRWAEAASWPVVMLVTIALLLAGVALWRFKQRDIQTAM